MIPFRQIEDDAAAQSLAVFGAFHGGPGAGLPGSGTLVLLGPREPGFWPAVIASPEWQDGAADPLDRWSARVIGTLAEGFGGRALFPFGGLPYHPFYRWAVTSGRAWVSPVTLLVHETAGLMVSYRGAILLPGRLELPPVPARSPCAECAGQPCLAACPAGALGASGYDLPACHGFLDTAAGSDCLSSGCRVRRACPISQGYGRLAAQSAYHMGLFHR